MKRPMPAVLVDAGPLVALLDRSDPDHVSCQGILSSITDSLVTVWPVLAEAMYLLRGYLPAQEALWEMIETGAVEILPLGSDDVPRMKELMRSIAICRWIWRMRRWCASPSANGCAESSPSIGATFKFIVLLASAAL